MSHNKDKRIEGLMAIVNPIIDTCIKNDFPDITSEIDEMLGYCKENFATPLLGDRNADCKFIDELMKSKLSEPRDPLLDLSNIKESLIVLVLMHRFMRFSKIRQKDMEHFGWFFNTYGPLVLNDTY